MFITLTRSDYPPIKININHITSFTRRTLNSNKTVIICTHHIDNGHYEVKETPEQIQELIDEQLLKMAKLSKSA